MKKAEARREFLQRRAALSEADYQHLNFQLYEQFFTNIDLSAVKCVNIFLPIEGKHEVDTWLIIDRLRREYEHIRLSVPRINGNGLENIYFEGLHQLKKNMWGILEPQQGVPTPTEKIDLVLVPLLAFDLKGHRVGYGKGFYDKFLSHAKKATIRLGLSLFESTERIEDTDAFDVPLNACLTPTKLYQF